MSINPAPQPLGLWLSSSDFPEKMRVTSIGLQRVSDSQPMIEAFGEAHVTNVSAR